MFLIAFLLPVNGERHGSRVSVIGKPMLGLAGATPHNTYARRTQPMNVQATPIEGE